MTNIDIVSYYKKKYNSHITKNPKIYFEIDWIMVKNSNKIGET